MYCKICGKKTKPKEIICKDCIEKEMIQGIITKGENEEGKAVKNKKHKEDLSQANVIGKILLILTAGLFPIHIFVWFGLGISAANEGGSADFSLYYIITVIVMAIIGFILSKKDKSTFLIIAIPVIIILLLVVFQLKNL